jgi:hypothetical protein
MKLHTNLLIALALMMLITGASAITTGAATAVGSNNATIACTGASGAWFVKWGSTNMVYWQSPNQSSGTSYRIHESPMMGNTVFFYQCCDSTGCGSQGTFTSLPVTPLPTQTIGGLYENMTENGYDLPSIAANLITPYVWNSNMSVTIIFMLLFSPIFIGVWLRSRSALIALLLGFITGGFILTANANPIGIGMPVEVVAIAQAMMYISFAGAVLYILHR